MLLFIVLLVCGLLAVTRAELRITRNRVVTGDKCKLIGAILIAGAVGMWFIPLAGIAALIGAIVFGLINSEKIEPVTEKVKN